MAVRLSTGLVDKLLDTGSLKSIFAGCFIDIYSGTQPALPDNAPTGTLLCTVYSDGASLGLHLNTSASGGTISKLSTETWSGTILASGTAGWFRMREATDAGTAASSTASRIDGAIATSGAELNLSTLAFTAGAPFVIPTAAFSLPQS